MRRHSSGCRPVRVSRIGSVAVNTRRPPYDGNLRRRTLVLKEYTARRRSDRLARYAVATALLCALLVLFVPLTGSAGVRATTTTATFVDPTLLPQAKGSPSTTFSVIVQSSLGLSDAQSAVTQTVTGVG